jgi:hypothetical protein
MSYIRTGLAGITFARSYWKCWKCQVPLQPWQNEGDEFVCSVEGCGGKITPGGLPPIDEIASCKYYGEFSEGFKETEWWKWKV